MVDTTLEMNLYKLQALFHHCYIGNKLNELEIVMILMGKHINWVKSLLCHEFSYFLSGKHMKGTMHMLIIWEKVGTKLFWLLRWEHFSSGDVLSRFFLYVCSILLNLKWSGVHVIVMIEVFTIQSDFVPLQV